MRVDPSDIRLLAPESIYGIEIHTVATAPVKYKIGNCGAIFLWSK